MTFSYRIVLRTMKMDFLNFFSWRCFFIDFWVIFDKVKFLIFETFPKKIVSKILTWLTLGIIWCVVYSRDLGASFELFSTLCQCLALEVKLEQLHFFYEKNSLFHHKNKLTPTSLSPRLKICRWYKRSGEVSTFHRIPNCNPSNK